MPGTTAQHSCVEFHPLLLAALLVYEKALCELNAGKGKPGQVLKFQQI
jgi:hypothetical protein